MNTLNIFELLKIITQRSRKAKIALSNLYVPCLLISLWINVSISTIKG